MSSIVVALDQLRRSDRWKVEFFLAPKPANGTSRFRAVALGQLVEERREFLDPQEFSEHQFHYIGLEHIAPNTGDLVDYAPRFGREVKSRSKVARTDDVLYGRLRPYLNKVFHVPAAMGNCICSGEFYVLIPDLELVDPTFLRSLLACRLVSRLTSDLQTGSALPRLQLADLLRVEVPLPQLDMQRRITRLVTTIANNRAKMRCRLEQEYTRFQDSFAEMLVGDTSMPVYKELIDGVSPEEPPRLDLPASYSPRPRTRSLSLFT